MGTILWVDLSSGAIRHEALDPEMARDFVGGYGIGARLLYERMPTRWDQKTSWAS
jgi:aldehyde:ferredoxin oxidoreductase